MKKSIRLYIIKILINKMDKSYCKKCRKTKKIDDFYKSSLSRCKDCRKKDVQKNNYRKNEVLCMMDNIYNKINSIEILYSDLSNKYGNIIDLLSDNKINDQENEIIKTLDNISLHDKKIKENINTIINYNKSNIKYDENYEKNLKEILNDDI